VNSTGFFSLVFVYWGI